MKSLLIAAVVGLMAVGCAEGVDDPQPGPDPTALDSAGNAHQFSADLPDTHIDPAKIGTGVSTPKENLTYDNPSPHPGWTGERLTDEKLADTQLDNAEKINVERTFDAKTLYVVRE